MIGFRSFLMVAENDNIGKITIAKVVLLQAILLLFLGSIRVPKVLALSCSPVVCGSVYNSNTGVTAYTYCVDPNCSATWYEGVNCPADQPNCITTLCGNGYYEGRCAGGCCPIAGGGGGGGGGNTCECGKNNAGNCIICGTIVTDQCPYGVSGHGKDDMNNNIYYCCDPPTGACSATCGGGFTVANACGLGGGNPCNTQPCCDANDWSVWTSCSSGETTQARANACGTIQTQACPAITGTVYYDPNNSCATNAPGNLGLPLSVTYNGSQTVNVGSNGTYTILTGTAGSGNTILNGLTSTYECSTCNPLGCPGMTGVVSPSVGNNFFIADKPLAWWQAVGGAVYVGSKAGGTTVSTSIPRTVPAAERYLIIPGSTTSVAALLRASGSVSTGNGSVSSTNYSAISEYKGKRMDYQFFAGQVGVTFAQLSDWGADTMNQPAYTAGRKFFYQKPAKSPRLRKSRRSH
jgi:hypothetical protein